MLLWKITPFVQHICFDPTPEPCSFSYSGDSTQIARARSCEQGAVVKIGHWNSIREYSSDPNGLPSRFATKILFQQLVPLTLYEPLSPAFLGSALLLYNCGRRGVHIHLLTLWRCPSGVPTPGVGVEAFEYRCIVLQCSRKFGTNDY